MPVSAQYLEYVMDQLSSVGDVTSKRMFGGVGFYFDQLFFGVIDDDTVYFKVDDQTRQRYERAGAKGFDPYGDGRPSIGYYTVPVNVLEDRDELRVWALDSIEVARRAASKKKKRAAGSAKKKAAEQARGAGRAKK